MKKIILIGALSLFLPALAVLAASNSFTADGAITVAGVQNGSLNVTFTISSGATAESWVVSSSTGAFEVTTASGSNFKVKSSNSSVAAIGYYSGLTGTCTVNTTPGTTEVSITSVGTYAILPYATTNCCTVVTNVSTYNAYPACGPATCASGYTVSGSQCVLIGGGGVISGGGGGGGYIIPTPTPTTYPSGSLLRASSSDKVYLIDNGKKRWIPTGEIFAANGYSWANVKVVDAGVIAAYSEGTNVSQAQEQAPSIAEGALIRALGDIDVYIVKYVGAKKFKRLILSPSVFNSYGHLKWSDIKDVEKSVLDSFVTSDLVRAVGDAKVYKLYPAGDTGEKRWVQTAEVFTKLGLDWDAIYEINQVDRDSYKTGEVLQ